jgi:hypothetical protein
MRDVRNIGKHRIGETEFALRSPEQLARLQALSKASYLRNRKEVPQSVPSMRAICQPQPVDVPQSRHV